MKNFLLLFLFLFVWNILEGIAKGILNFKLFPEGKTADNIMQFFPLNSMSNLIKQPFSRLSAVQSVANQVGEKFDFDYAVHWYEIVIVLFWTAIFIFLSYRLLKMRDL